MGIHAFKTRGKESRQVLGKYLKINDVDALAETYTVYSRLVPAKPLVTAAGLQMILGEIAKSNPRAKTAKPDDFMDLRFVRELEATGFIDRLYK